MHPLLVAALISVHPSVGLPGTHAQGGGSRTPEQRPVEASAPAPAGPRAVLEARDGTRRSLPLADLNTSDPRQLDASLVWFDGLPAAARGAAPAIVRLAGGELLCGDVVRATGETIEFALSAGIPVFVELERIQSLRWPERLKDSTAIEPAKEGDRLYRALTGSLERIDGAVEEFNEQGVRFHGQLVGSLQIAWSDVAALFVEHLGARDPAPESAGAPIVLDLDDGSRLRGVLEKVDGREVRLVRNKAPIVVPIAHAVLLTVDDGGVQFLSGIAPAAAEASRPFGDDLGMVWPHRVDRTVTGGVLSAGSRRHPRGLGVHAPSRLTWALDGGARSLRGEVAIDDEVLRLAARGSAVFRVRVDGREAWASPVLHAGDAPVAFKVPLAGAREVVLEVDPTEDGFACDRADWLGLVLETDQVAERGSKR